MNYTIMRTSWPSFNQTNHSSVIGGSACHTVSGTYSSVLGGKSNSVSGTYSSIFGGGGNIIPAGFTNAHIAGSSITAVNSNSLHVNGLWANGLPFWTFGGPPGPPGTVFVAAAGVIPSFGPTGQLWIV